MTQDHAHFAYLLYSQHQPPMSTTAAPTPRLTRDDVLDARQVAELLHLPISTALDFARRGVIPGHKLGRRWIFLRDEIEAGVRDAPNRPATPRAPERPARNAEGRPPHQPKRYPRAVPAATAPSQRQLFGSSETACLQADSPLEPAGIEPATSCLQSRRSPS